MTSDNNHLNEEELRRAIRAEIEQRDLENRRQQQRKQARKEASEHAEAKRRIYKEELRRYYQNRPGYKEIMGEDGETEWVAEDEAKDNEILFDPVAEDPMQARKFQKYLFLVFSVVIIMAGALLIYLLGEGEGTIIVTCNVKGAAIVLDAVNTNYYTDDTVYDVPSGEHFVTVEKSGYRIVGDEVTRVDIRKGEDVRVSFILEVESETSSGENVEAGDVKETMGEQ